MYSLVIIVLKGVPRVNPRWPYNQNCRIIIYYYFYFVLLIKLLIKYQFHLEINIIYLIHSPVLDKLNRWLKLSYSVIALKPPSERKTKCFHCRRDTSLLQTDELGTFLKFLFLTVKRSFFWHNATTLCCQITVG